MTSSIENSAQNKIEMILSQLKNLIKKIFLLRNKTDEMPEKISEYKPDASEPWSNGYNEYKWQSINESINNSQLLEQFKDGLSPLNFGIGLDERIVEYTWLFSRKILSNGKFLDAGSTFNFEELINHKQLQNSAKYIYTYYPEYNNYGSQRVSYIYGDLRSMPFRDDFFDTVICQSTLEHIAMDNSMYGYELGTNEVKEKNYEYLAVIEELIRVTSPGGKILLTFPYGVFENHGFFQQLDEEMATQILNIMSKKCNVQETYFKYFPTGWIFSDRQKCNDAKSFNPHTGVGRGNDNAAHSRAICCLEAIKL